MDYEKKYNEALERARKEYNSHLEHLYEGYRKHLEEIFPELAESEDERIRKALYKMAKVPRKEIYEAEGITKEQALAWLEKQKEQKLAERFAKAREKYQVEWSEEDEAAYDAFICEVVNEKMNPTIEQVKWLRSIRDRLKSLRPHWKPSEYEERLINTSISFLKDFADKGYENAVECIDWLKSKLNGNSCK